LNCYLRSTEEKEYLKVLMMQIRKDHPTMNGVAMYYKINPVTMGRDKFLKLCKEMGFVVKQKTRFRGTTDSRGVIRFPNLMQSAAITNMNQAFCSDITYYEVNGAYYYITFIMDCYSRRILGHSVSGRLLTEHTTLPALKQAIKSRKPELPRGIIFHSDGGGQYYDSAFLELTHKYHFKNSMCEYAYENGKAERINGVIKNNYLRFKQIDSLKDLVREVDCAVYKYNYEKPHKELRHFTPLAYEKKLLSLQQQTKPTMTESFDAKTQDLWGVEPQNPEQTKPQNQDVFSAKTNEKNVREVVNLF